MSAPRGGSNSVSMSCSNSWSISGSGNSSRASEGASARESDMEEVKGQFRLDSCSGSIQAKAQPLEII